MTRIAACSRTPWLAFAALAVTTVIAAFATRAEPRARPPTEPMHDCVLRYVDVPPEPRRQMPQACEDYGRVLEVLASCESLPVDARDALRQSWAAVVQSFGELTPEAADAVGDACTQARAALVDAVRTLCPLEVAR